MDAYGLSKKYQTKNALDKKHFVKDEYGILFSYTKIRGATLHSRVEPVHSAGYLHIPGN